MAAHPLLEDLAAQRGGSVSDQVGPLGGMRPSNVVLVALACQLTVTTLTIALTAFVLVEADRVSLECVDVSEQSPRVRVYLWAFGALCVALISAFSIGSGLPGFYALQVRGLVRERGLLVLFSASVMASVAVFRFLAVFNIVFVVYFALLQDNFLALYGGAARARAVPVVGGCSLLANYVLVTMLHSSCGQAHIGDTLTTSMSTVVLARLLRVFYIQYRAHDHVYFGSFNLKVERVLRGEAVDASTPSAVG